MERLNVGKPRLSSTSFCKVVVVVCNRIRAVLNKSVARKDRVPFLLKMFLLNAVLEKNTGLYLEIAVSLGPL